MSGSSKESQEYLEPPTPGVPPVDSPFTPPRDGVQSQAGELPTASSIRSPWFRKPDRSRLKHVQIDAGPVSHLEDDAELGGDSAGSVKTKKMICGCSQPTFVIVLFFVIVVIAAAIGGGVGGSLFATKR